MSCFKPSVGLPSTVSSGCLAAHPSALSPAREKSQRPPPGRNLTRSSVAGRGGERNCHFGNSGSTYRPFHALDVAPFETDRQGIIRAGQGPFSRRRAGQTPALLFRATGGGLDRYNACLLLPAAYQESFSSPARLMFAKHGEHRIRFTRRMFPGIFKRTISYHYPSGHDHSPSPHHAGLRPSLLKGVAPNAVDRPRQEKRP